jgi:murein DD-endopeptidase MepM/ murein hydrolase activator NlpD
MIGKAGRLAVAIAVAFLTLSTGSVAAAHSSASSAPEIITIRGAKRTCPVQPSYFYDTWGDPRSGGRTHKGTDIIAPADVNVYAYRSGTVTNAGYHGDLAGLGVTIAHDNIRHYPATSKYFHLNAVDVEVGQYVQAGQRIGANGSTGNASESLPHVHFEYWLDGAPVNPYYRLTEVC